MWEEVKLCFCLFLFIGCVSFTSTHAFAVDPNSDSERGPKFVLQPKNITHDTWHNPSYTTIRCRVDSNPRASIVWTLERDGQVVEIDPVTDSRYTAVGGLLIIHNPSPASEVDGRYQARASNAFGTVVSNTATLDFGYLLDFPTSPRTPVMGLAYAWTSLECIPPPHYPDVEYIWYKENITNVIQPELQPNMFICSEGRLYMSEINTEEAGKYYCVVYKPGQAPAEGKVSMPVELKVLDNEPGVWEPEIGSGFPMMHPWYPKVGDNLRLECWASGTTRLGDLIYSWDKVEELQDGSLVVLPMPEGAEFSNHNRFLLFENVKASDAGIYRCNVQRPGGWSTYSTVEFKLLALPYFTLDLHDKMVDLGTDLAWQCQAEANPAPTYSWLKNGDPLSNDTILEEDKGRVVVSNNVLIIKNLDPEKDNGMYQCVATNSLDTRYSTGQLTVLK